MTNPARRKKQTDRSLSDIFNHFTKDSVERFPSLDGRLLIFDANDRVSYGRDMLNLKKAGRSSAAIDAFLKENTSHAENGTYADWGNNLKLRFIFYDESVSTKERNAVSAKTEKDILFILDHELAHLVIKDPSLAGENGQYKQFIKEAIADAYALMRHYQRYGAESKHRNSIIDPWSRAAALALNKDTWHFSTIMLDEMIKLKDIIDYASLSPQQTAELAKRFAVEYTPPSSVVNKAVRKLRPVKKAYKASPDSDEWLKTLAKITLNPKNDPYTFKLCSKILGGYLDGRIDQDGRSAPWATGDYWDNIRKSLKEAELRFAKENILFNIPLMKDKKPPRAANQNKPA